MSAALDGTRGRPLRVAYVVGSYQRFTGSQRSLFLLVQHLDRRRVEPVMIFPGEGACSERFRQLDVPVIVRPPAAALGEFGGGLLRASLARRALLALTGVAPYALGLARWLRRERIDVLHANDSRALLLAGPAARLAGVPAVWHVRGDVAPLGPLYLHACGALASRIITVADGIRGSVPARWASKMTTIHNGVELPAAGTVPAPGKELLVVSVGSLVPFKGAHHLIAAVRGMKDVRVVFVGDRPDPAYARHLDTLAADNVTFAGWDDEPAHWFRAADAVCLPTVADETLTLDGQPRRVRGTEGLSRTVLEAMAHGRAIVATRVAGVPEQIVDGESGLIVPPSEPKALAAALARLRDPAFRARLGAHAAARAATKFSVAAMVDATTALYARTR